MRRTVFKSKIHRATVTDTHLDYEGSLTVDTDLLEAADILPYEQIHVWDVTNGQRIETYAIRLPEGSGRIVVNGAAARHFQPGDRVIIAAFYLTDEPVVPQMIAVDEHNRFVKTLDGTASPEDLVTTVG